MSVDFSDEAVKAIPGVAGSFTALRWSMGSVWHGVFSIFGGAAIAYYGTPYFVAWSGIAHRDFTAFLLGLFGMAVVAKLFEAISAMDGRKIFTGIFPGKR